MVDEPTKYQRSYERLQDALSYLYTCNTLIEVVADQDVQDDYFMDMDRAMIILEHQMWDMYLTHKIAELPLTCKDIEQQAQEVSNINALRRFLSMTAEMAAEV